MTRERRAGATVARARERETRKANTMSDMLLWILRTWGWHPERKTVALIEGIGYWREAAELRRWLRRRG